MVKILHIVDDPKFYEYVRTTFDIGEVRNILITSDELFQYNSAEVAKFEFVIIHYLNIKKALWLNKCKPKKVIWFIWGSDIYNLAKFRNTLHLAQTNKLLDTFRSKLRRNIIYKKIMFQWMPFLYDNYYNRQKIKAFNNIHLAVPVIPADFGLLKLKYKVNFPMFNMNYLIPNLSSIENFKINGQNILLGNSAHPTNNHLDVLLMLRKSKIDKGRKIIVPLNYGNSKYKSSLIKIIKQNDDLDFVLLTKPIPLENYRKTMRGCNVMIFNTLRQQAFGTILHGLMMGAHIYLNKCSPQYSFLKEKGFIISAIEENLNFKGLSENDIISNKNNVYKIYGVSENKNKVRKLLNL